MFVTIFISAIVTILHSFNYGSIDFFLVVPLILGSIVGVQLGQKLGQYLDSNQLKSLFALLLCSVAIAIGYNTFFRDQSKLINEQQVTSTDLNKYAEFSLKLSNDFPFLYGAFAIILAMSGRGRRPPKGAVPAGKYIILLCIFYIILSYFL